MKICYFGIYNSKFGRNSVYIKGLKENGVVVVECADASAGVRKFWRLWQKHLKIIKDGGYDVLVVGYPGHLLVPFAKLLSRKKIVLDALCTLWEGEILSRAKSRWRILKRLKVFLIDWLAIYFADCILVESNAQVIFFKKNFKISHGKVFRVFTGVDDSIFFSSQVTKHPCFTAVFRGRFLPEAGVQYILRAAKILENQNINFLIIGDGFTGSKIRQEMEILQLKNVEWLWESQRPEQLRVKMLQCHVALGQFENHERLSRTIPHKAFEALALGLPYITGKSAAVQELLIDGESVLFTELANPKDLADKILFLKNNTNIAEKIAAAGSYIYKSQLIPKKLGEIILDIIRNI